MTAPPDPLRPLGHLRYLLLYGDISFTVLLGGLGLVLWALFGVLRFAGDLAAYAAMFPLGNGTFWVANYIFCGVAMWVLAAFRFPPLSSLVVGAWVTGIWGWSAIARLTATATLQTGNATSVIYIILGILIVHRSARSI